MGGISNVYCEFCYPEQGHIGVKPIKYIAVIVLNSSDTVMRTEVGYNKDALLEKITNVLNGLPKGKYHIELGSLTQTVEISTKYEFKEIKP